MSCFAIPEWRHIALQKGQRNQLKYVNMQAFVKTWTEKKMPANDRIWDLKRAMRIKTFTHQPDLPKEVLDKPRGVMCIHAPPETVTLLNAANVALASLFTNVEASEKKYRDYLHHIHGETRSSYVQDRKDAGYTLFNYCTAEDYARHGRLSALSDLRGFWTSQSDFKVLDQFLSVYMKKMAQYFCGSADATPDEVARIEQIINAHGDMTIIKYEDQTGFVMHLDSLIRGDATVFTIGVGRDVVYDMSRAVGRKPDEEVSIIRSSNPEVTMIALDGESRYQWTHGIPHSSKPNGAKYTIHISLSHTAGLTDCIGKCEEIDVPMYSAPACKTPSNPHSDSQHKPHVKHSRDRSCKSTPKII